MSDEFGELSAVEWGKNVLGNPTNDDIVMGYGIAALVMATLSVSLYFPLEFNWIVRSQEMLMLIHQFSWWPVGLIWVATYFIEGEWIRRAFQIATVFSLVGPFGGYWISIGNMMMKAEKKYKKNGRGWTSLKL